MRSIEGCFKIGKVIACLYAGGSNSTKWENLMIKGRIDRTTPLIRKRR